MIYVDLWSRKIGIPYKEYSVMPLGELNDMISGYQILNGISKEANNELYIPSLK